MKFLFQGESVIKCFLNRWHRRYTSYTGWSMRKHRNVVCSYYAGQITERSSCSSLAARECLDADGGHFEHLHWIQNSRTSLTSILLLYK